MNSYDTPRHQLEFERRAEEMYSPVEAAAREVLATLLTMRSELTSNGVAHTSADLVALTQIVFSQTRPVRR
jgi:hypothetical protein